MSVKILTTMLGVEDPTIRADELIYYLRYQRGYEQLTNNEQRTEILTLLLPPDSINTGKTKTQLLEQIWQLDRENISGDCSNEIINLLIGYHNNIGKILINTQNNSTADQNI